MFTWLFYSSNPATYVKRLMDLALSVRACRIRISIYPPTLVIRPKRSSQTTSFHFRGILYLSALLSYPIILDALAKPFLVWPLYRFDSLYALACMVHATSGRSSCCSLKRMDSCSKSDVFRVLLCTEIRPPGSSKYNSGPIAWTSFWETMFKDLAFSRLCTFQRSFLDKRIARQSCP